MDREKVAKGLETIRFNLRQMNHGLLADFCDDAIAMLKEQEAVLPTLIREGRNKYYNDYVCPGCDNELHYGQNYCSECGRSVKWG